MMREPCVRGIGTALPEHVIGLDEAEAFARRRFAALPGLERLLPAFAHTGIDRRQLVRPLSWYEPPRSFAEKNAVWAEGALALGTAAAEQALARAALPRDAVAAIVWVTSTGIATPSLDAALVARLGLRRDVQRLPLWGLGCAGGAAGLARAAALCRGLQRPVLLIAAEVCSATFVAADCSRRNLVATALFADGAAAAVLAPGGPGPRILGGAAQLLPDSEDVMGWDLRDEGLQVRFARSIPALVQAMLPEFVAAAIDGVGRQRDGLRHFALHPGGAKVLAAYQQCLALDDAQLAPARAVLGRCGNMSSPTALFVLQQLLAEDIRGLGLVVGLGPGFCAEAAVFEA